MNSYPLAARHVWRGVVLFVVTFTALSAGALAQTPTDATPQPSPQAQPSPTLERQLFKNILRDQRAIWTAPLRVRGDDLQWLAPLGLATGVLIATDRETAGALNDARGRLSVSRDVSYAGSLYTAGALAATSYLVGRGSNNPRLRETGLLGAEALVDSVIVYSALKEITQRPRPREDAGHGRFFTGGDSFPSGHATNAWSLATVVAYEYQDRPLVHWGAYGVAALVSVSRFTGRKHFLSDVLVGSAIGYGIGRYVYQTHHDPALGSSGGEAGVREKSKLWPLIAPSYDRRGRDYGLTLAWSF